MGPANTPGHRRWSAQGRGPLEGRTACTGTPDVHSCRSTRQRQQKRQAQAPGPGPPAALLP
eukprot:980485-Prorocentrum_lima.AAC.1